MIFIFWLAQEILEKLSSSLALYRDIEVYFLRTSSQEKQHRTKMKKSSSTSRKQDSRGSGNSIPVLGVTRVTTGYSHFPFVTPKSPGSLPVISGDSWVARTIKMGEKPYG